MTLIDKDQNTLLPDRHPQQELFICDVSDAVLKDDMASMEHPVFTLSKKPDLKIRKYRHGDAELEVIPSVKGLANIYDKDILIFAISQLIAARNEGRPVSKQISISARQLLIFTNRATGGRNYELLEESLLRLSGTRLKTNIKTGGEVQTDIFGLVDSANVRRSSETGRIVELRIVLSDWVFNAVDSLEVLTLHKDYFRLRKPIERRLYEISRKHCGEQKSWKISLTLLKKKCGSNSPMKQFRYTVREIVRNGYLPDYDIELDEEDFIIFTNRGVADRLEKSKERVGLSAETYHDARTVAPSWDVYVLEEKWRSWMIDGGLDQPKNPDKAFIGFCRKWFERNGTA